MGLPDNKNGWIGYGWGVVNVGVDDVPMDRAEVARRMIYVLDDPEWRPPVLPAVATKLIDMTRRASTSVADVTQLLAGDPTLAA